MPFWRDKTGNKIDPPIERAGEHWPVEVKSGATFQRDWLHGPCTWQRYAAAGRQDAPTLIAAAPGNCVYDVLTAHWCDTPPGLAGSAS